MGKSVLVEKIKVLEKEKLQLQIKVVQLAAEISNLRKEVEEKNNIFI